jgi:hypothetical protein
MTAAPRDILVLALRERPGLLASLLERLMGSEVKGALVLQPSDPPLARCSDGADGADGAGVAAQTGRAAAADVVVLGESPAFVVVEVIERRDEARRAGWPLLLAAQAARTGQPGELLVLTSSKRVARWASRAIVVRGPLGTTLRVKPLVLLLGLEAAERLVDEAASDLAVAAAWAVHRKYGPRSSQVARRALLLTDLQGEPWRSTQLHGILRVLHQRTLLDLLAMTPDELPESEAFRRFKDALISEAEARGKAGALLRYLELRGISLSPEQQTHVAACRDLSTVDRWVEGVFSAGTKGEMIEALFG